MMSKHFHEIRDPIHNFICFDSEERIAIDSKPIQRLRHIHQLALTYLVYPGATHRRFEHSLGVMELASRVYDVVTDPNNICYDSVRNIIPNLAIDRPYWRRVLRMAALFHDVGHLPFSHAAEKMLLPDGWNHERITAEIIRSKDMEKIWKELRIQTEHVVKLAIGSKHYKDGKFDDWEAILSEIIVGDSLGVDRMDYLLRDSYHTGVAYGKFDHYRLIDTIRILPKEWHGDNGSKEPVLGVESGGLHSVEAMLLARYFMYTQLYFHPIRRIYDIHLRDFLKIWLQNRFFPIEVENHLQISDNEVFVELFKAAQDCDYPGHDHAKRIVKRDHFKVLYKRNPDDMSTNLEAPKFIFRETSEKFGAENVRCDSYTQKGGVYDFPVRNSDGRITSAFSMSEVLKNIPAIAIDFIYINPENRLQAEKWLSKNLEHIIKNPTKE